MLHFATGNLLRAKFRISSSSLLNFEVAFRKSICFFFRFKISFHTGEKKHSSARCTLWLLLHPSPPHTSIFKSWLLLTKRKQPSLSLSFVQDCFFSRCSKHNHHKQDIFLETLPNKFGLRSAHRHWLAILTKVCVVCRILSLFSFSLFSLSLCLSVLHMAPDGLHNQKNAKKGTRNRKLPPAINHHYLCYALNLFLCNSLSLTLSLL